MPNPVLQVLAPIKEAAEILHAARYALRLMENGTMVKVCTLYVAKRVGGDDMALPPLAEHVRAVEERAWAVLNEATSVLVARNVPHLGIVRSGEVVFTILDIAEEMQCNEIYLPPRQAGSWQDYFSKGITERLVTAQRSIPVVTSR